MKNLKKISIIIPVYCEEQILERSIQEFLKLKKTLKEYILEYVFVDDGSTDGSWLILEKYAKKYKNEIVAVRLMKNVGSWDAVSAGLSSCSGDAAFLVSADLQEPAESMVEMARIWSDKIKIVYGMRERREDPFFQKLFARLYYRIFRLIAIPDYPVGGLDFCLLDRVVFERVLALNEKNTHMHALIFSFGYPSAYVSYSRQKRIGGKSKWTFKKRLKLSLDSFISFSHVPIRMIGWIGFLYAVISITYGVVIIIAKVVLNEAPEGWSALAFLSSFTAGVQILMLSIIGEYLWRILDAVRSRPSYIVQEVLNKKKVP